MSAEDNLPPRHPYFGRTAVMATKHEKDLIARPILKGHLGLGLLLAPGIDTDTLGTFSGEIERIGSPRDTAIQKAKLGISATGIPLGIANEGSFGPHPRLPFFSADQEIFVFVDMEREVVIEEFVVSTSTNVGEIKVSRIQDAEEFLSKRLFGTHAMVVRPNVHRDQTQVRKGIQDRTALGIAIRDCAQLSSDGLAHIETDMRANLNPTRQGVIAEAAEKLALRIKTLCPDCRIPGWGVVDCIMGLPCESCEYPTQMIHKEIYGCVKCRFRQVVPRADRKLRAPTQMCPVCNP